MISKHFTFFICSVLFFINLETAPPKTSLSEKAHLFQDGSSYYKTYNHPNQFRPKNRHKHSCNTIPEPSTISIITQNIRQTAIEVTAMYVLARLCILIDQSNNPS